MVLGLLAIWYTHETAAKDAIAAARQVSQNQAALLQAADDKDRQASAAQAKGDINRARDLAKEAADLRNQAGAPGKRPDDKPQDWQVWLQKNIGWVFVGTAAVLVAPQLVKKL